MRPIYAILIFSLAAMSAACLAGHGQATTTTSYTYDDGLNPVRKESVTQTYSGSTVGANLPLIVGGVGTTINGQIPGSAQGGSSTLCTLYPDRCASSVTVHVPQPNVIMASGYGGAMTVAPGGQPQVVGTGSSPSYAPTAGVTVDITELQKRLHDLEKATAVIGPALKEDLRLKCQMVLGKPDLVPDPDQRKQVVNSCTAQLAQK